MASEILVRKEEKRSLEGMNSAPKISKNPMFL